MFVLCVFVLYLLSNVSRVSGLTILDLPFYFFNISFFQISIALILISDLIHGIVFNVISNLTLLLINIVFKFTIPIDYADSHHTNLNINCIINNRLLYYLSCSKCK